MSDKPELLPCPFCDDQPLPVAQILAAGAWIVACSPYGGCGTRGPLRATAEDAIAAWNRRSPEPLGAAWRPIAEGPRDGTRVLVTEATGRSFAVVHAGIHAGNWLDDAGIVIAWATHFMPLPAAPGDSDLR